MGETTKIAWCDHTFNPWRGCSKVSAGCANCYAERQSRRNPAVLGVWGERGSRVVAADAYWRLPERWDKVAAKAGVRRRVFLGSLMDFFEPWPDLMRDHDGERTEATMEALRHRVFALVDRTPHLDWLIVTKRPENIRRMWRPVSGYRDDLGGDGQTMTEYRPNVWLLASVEDQPAAHTRIPHLLACRDLVPVLGLSCEPLIGPIYLRGILHGGLVTDALTGSWAATVGQVRSGCHQGKIDWLIAGGESGSSARPCDVAWIRSLRDQCAAAGVPFFAKQLGARPVEDDPILRCHWPPLTQFRATEDACYVVPRDPAGADPAEWPEVLRVREFPEAAP